MGNQALDDLRQDAIDRRFRGDRQRDRLQNLRVHPALYNEYSILENGDSLS